jgi:hypothetical protein
MELNFDADVDPSHLTRVITDAGERQPLLAKAGIYDRLMALKLQLPLEQSPTATNLLHGCTLRESMEAPLDMEPFYGRMTASSQQRTLFLDVREKLPLPEPVAFQRSVERDAHLVLFRTAGQELNATPNK